LHLSRQATEQVSRDDGGTQHHQRTLAHIAATGFEKGVLLLLELVGALGHPIRSGARCTCDFVHRTVRCLRYAIDRRCGFLSRLFRNVIHDLMCVIGPPIYSRSA
jgi:hypothetical protein